MNQYNNALSPPIEGERVGSGGILGSLNHAPKKLVSSKATSRLRERVWVPARAGRAGENPTARHCERSEATQGTATTLIKISL